MAQNNEFRQACKAWFQATLALLENKPLPVYMDTEGTFTSNSWQAQRTIHKPDYTRLYSTYRDELLSLPEFGTLLDIVTQTPALASVILVDADGKAIPPQSGLQKDWLESYLSRFLFEYLKSNKSLVFSSAEYEHLYEKLEQYIYSTEPINGVWLVHLRNLTSELELITLERDIYLRQATNEEKEHALKNDLNFWNLIRDIPNVFLEIDHPIDRISPPDQQAANNIAQAVVLALRLLKAGAVGIVSYDWLAPDQPFRQAGYKFSPLLHPSAFHGEPYVLTQADAEVLPKLWRKAKKAYTETKLSTVITRFEDAYTRTKPEDKLIDYWTALEALFFLEDEFQDMGKSLALAASYYLGRTSSERTTIYNDLIRSHTLRSHYIHGERKQTRHPLDEMVTKTGTHLRSALRKRIEESEN